jgi:hypothetical protein
MVAYLQKVLFCRTLAHPADVIRLEAAYRENSQNILSPREVRE